jgi:hypothetical protein
MSNVFDEELKDFDFDISEDEGTWSDLGPLEWCGDPWWSSDAKSLLGDTELSTITALGDTLGTYSAHLRETVLLFRTAMRRLGEVMERKYTQTEPEEPGYTQTEPEEPGYTQTELPPVKPTGDLYSNIPEFPETEHYHPVETEFIVSLILNHRKGPFGRYEYLIKWDGFSSEENTWEPKKNLYGSDCLKMLQQYHMDASLPPFDVAITTCP